MPKLFHLLTISGDWRHDQFSLILMVEQTSCWNNFPLILQFSKQLSLFAWKSSCGSRNVEIFIPVNFKKSHHEDRFEQK